PQMPARDLAQDPAASARRGRQSARQVEERSPAGRNLRPPARRDAGAEAMTGEGAGSPRPRLLSPSRAIFAVFLVVVGINLILALRVPSSRQRGGSAARQAMAPLFAGPLVDGRSLSLIELRGKVVLLDFWASWCAPCI